jgi:NADH:ubiquinone oxidoreductase subunit H
MISRGIVALWTWVPAAFSVIALLAAAYVGLVWGAWASAEHFAFLGAFAAAVAIGCYFSFLRGRNSN